MAENKPTVEDTPSGPIVHTDPDNPGDLDLTHLYDSGVPDGPTGSTPPKAGSVRTFDDPAPVLPDPEGDTPRRVKDGPALVDVPDNPFPTVGDLRKAGYTVDGKAGDIPTAYTADSPTPPGEVHLVADLNRGPVVMDAVEVDGSTVSTPEGDQLGTVGQPKKAASGAKQVRSAPENK